LDFLFYKLNFFVHFFKAFGIYKSTEIFMKKFVVFNSYKTLT